MEIDLSKETRTLEDFWKPRNDQMLLDRERLRLTKPPITSDALRWISNEPKVFYDTAVALVSSYPARFRLPLSINFTPEEKEKMNKAERFILGIFRNLDSRQMNRGQSYWMRELAYQVMSGWYSVFTMINKNKDGVDFIADVWDPISIYPQWGERRLQKCVRAFEVEVPMAESMASGWAKKGLKFEMTKLDSRAKVKIINYWLDDNGTIYNAIAFSQAEKAQEIKVLKQEKLDHIPIFCGAIGIPDRTSINWQRDWGENIIASNRDMYDYENKMISLMATIMAETAYPNLVSETKTGEPVLKEGAKGYGEEIPLKIGEKIDLLKHAATPAEAFQLLSWVGKQKQKGSLPDTVYGNVPFELSGFAISQLMAAIRYKIAPYLVTMQYIMSSVASEFLTQYKKGNFPKITLSTTNPSAVKKGLFFVEEFDKKDVPDVRFVDVTIPITSALDKTQQILFSRQAMSPPQLLSRETLWDEYLDVQDSEQEYARIIQDQMLDMPVVKQIAMIEQLRTREQFYRNTGKIGEANALKQYIMALEMQLGMRQGIPITGKEGVRPEFSPPEAGQSPDALRSVLGMPPPGLSRRPQTSEERSESKLVNQFGQPI